MNSVQVVGVILNIKPPDERSTSARLVVRYGPIRKTRKNTDRQFVNAVEVRVPERNLDTISGLEPGMMVEVLARLQGIYQNHPMGPASLYSEVVASRIVRPSVKDQEAEPLDKTIPAEDHEHEHEHEES